MKEAVLQKRDINFKLKSTAINETNLTSHSSENTVVYVVKLLYLCCCDVHWHSESSVPSGKTHLASSIASQGVRSAVGPSRLSPGNSLSWWTTGTSQTWNNPCEHNQHVSQYFPNKQFAGTSQTWTRPSHHNEHEHVSWQYSKWNLPNLNQTKSSEGTCQLTVPQINNSQEPLKPEPDQVIRMNMSK